jgi:VRR-NUC domain.
MFISLPTDSRSIAKGANKGDLECLILSDFAALERLCDRGVAPKEHQIQRLLARYLDSHPATSGRWLHVPNERASRKQRRFLAGQGVKPGAPDVLIFARPGLVLARGVAIELKRRRGGRLSAAQSQWLTALRGEGWRAECCRGLRAAMELVIECYGSAGMRRAEQSNS